MKKVLSVVGALVLLAGCHHFIRGATGPLPPDYWPTQGWRTSTPEQQGMDSRLLADAVEYFKNEKVPLHSILIVRHGYVVLDAAFFPYEAGTLHDQASVTKSVVSTLIGIAIDRGEIRSVRQPVLSIFPTRVVENVDVDKRSMTVEDVLTMRSGLTCVWENLGGKTHEMSSSPDWIAYSFDRRTVAEPGTRFCYSNADSHLLSGIVRAATGTPASEYAREHLFGPLGITDFVWPADPHGNPVGWSELRVAPRDMAKIGFLMLHRGRWEAGQIVSEGWVEAATSGHVAIPGDDVFAGYGYQWWTSPIGFFTARGRGGQFIAVFPAFDMVVVTTGEIGADEELRKVGHALLTMLLPSIKSGGPLPPSKDGEARLAAAVQAAAAAPRRDPGAAARLPPVAQSVSGKTFTFPPNPIDLATLSVVFDESKPEASLKISRAPGGAFEIKVGLDGAPRFGKGRYGLAAMASGRWTSASTFEFDLDEIGNDARWSITATFEGDRVTLTAHGAGMGDLSLDGAAKK